MDGSIEQTKETNCRRCGSKLSGRLAFTLGGEVAARDARSLIAHYFDDRSTPRSS
jgi:hypothetical protein